MKRDALYPDDFPCLCILNSQLNLIRLHIILEKRSNHLLVRMITQQLPPSSKQNKKIRRYLIARHGETNYNKERRVQGTSDKSILTLDGISQASALGVYLYCRQAGEVLDNNDGADNNASVGEEVAPPITRTWCSPLTRCKQTYALYQDAVHRILQQTRNIIHYQIQQYTIIYVKLSYASGKIDYVKRSLHKIQPIGRYLRKHQRT